MFLVFQVVWKATTELGCGMSPCKGEVLSKLSQRDAFGKCSTLTGFSLESLVAGLPGLCCYDPSAAMCGLEDT